MNFALPLLFRLAVLSVVAASSVVAQSGVTPPDPESMFNYVLRPRDVIRVEVYRHGDLTREARIAADGTITLPLLNEVKVAGMSVFDAKTLIERRYNADYLVDPEVSIIVLSYTARRINIHGQVRSPGPVVIPPEEEMTLTQAIAASGGLTRLANADKVIIRRPREDGSIQVIEVDFDDILRDANASDITVYDGDNITVLEDPI